MRNSVLLSALFAAVQATPVRNGPAADGRYTIEAEGIKAQFIEYGATLTNLWVKDKNGKDVDVVLGYDDAKFYPVDPNHPVYNSIPGRYVNRIGNAKYTIDGKTYQTEANDGPNTLHSGRNNWSYRFWNVTRSSKDSITFSIVDPADAEIGFPTQVMSSVTYKVKKNTWDIKMEATSPDAKTPIMLTQHAYFNLDAYKDPATDKIWDHTLHMPYSARYLEAGQDAVPTGKILTAAPGSINDFASKDGITLGHAKNDPAFAGNCGADGACEGYNGQFLIDRPKGVSKDDVVLTLASKFSGITADLRTDQVGLVIYSCNWFNGTADGASKLKSTQLGVAGRTTVGRSSCVAIEPHDYVDGINHPEWKRVEEQITGPGEKYKWHSSWTFGVEGKGPVGPPGPGCKP